MPRNGSSYRGARRSACIHPHKQGHPDIDNPAGVWPKDGVQLDPEALVPVQFYKTSGNPKGTTAKMIEAGRVFIRRILPKAERLKNA